MTSPFVKPLQENDRILFVHIRKTGGTSLRTLMDIFFAVEDINSKQIYDLQGFYKELATLSRYRFLRGHVPYTIAQYIHPDPFVITMLRHPVKRIVSLYKHARREERNIHFIRDEALEYDLFNFVRYFAIHPLNRPVPVINEMTAFLGWQIDFQEQVHQTTPDRFWISPDSENLELAKQRLAILPFFGITERFADSMRLLCYTFGFFPHLDYLRQNESQSKLSEESSDEILCAIAEFNSLDIELYNYANLLFEERFQAMLADLLVRYKPDKNLAKLSNDDWAELLDIHYTDLYRQRYITRSNNYCFDMKDGIDGTGWHMTEYQPTYQRWVRWTGPSTTSIIDLPIETEHALKLECDILRALSPDVFNSLQIEINGYPADITVQPLEGQQRLVTVYIPKSILTEKPYIRVQFKINATIRPTNINPEKKDTRQLGLLFNEIRVLPA